MHEPPLGLTSISAEPAATNAPGVTGADAVGATPTPCPRGRLSRPASALVAGSPCRAAESWAKPRLQVRRGKAKAANLTSAVAGGRCRRGRPSNAWRLARWRGGGEGLVNPPLQYMVKKKQIRPSFVFYLLLVIAYAKNVLVPLPSQFRGKL